MIIMGRARHSRRGPRRTAFGLFYSILVVVIAFAVTIPMGSVGFSAMQGVAALAWMLGVAGILVGWARSHAETRPAERMMIMAMGLLLGWCGVQLIPLPESWAAIFWRGDAELWKKLSAGTTGWTMAVDRFVSVHTLLLWSGLGALFWGCSRQIRGRSLCSVLLLGLMGLGVLQSILGIFFLKTETGRICGTFGSPDALGGLLAMTLPVTMGLMFSNIHWRDRRGSSILHRLGYDWVIWRGILFAAVMGMQVTALYFTGSRGAAFSALAALSVLLIILGKERVEFRSRLFAAGAVLLVLMVLFGIQGRRANLMDRTFGKNWEFQQATVSRVEIWKSAVALCSGFPFGTGPGGTVLMLPMYQTGAYGRFRLDYAHNDSLQFLGDLGIVGFGALTCILGLVLSRGAGGCRRGAECHGESIWLMRGAWAAVLAALCHAQVDFNLSGRPGIQVVFVILCGLLWGSNPDRDDSAAKCVPPVRHWLGKAGILLGICALAVVLSLRAAWAWRIHEGAVAALGLTQDAHLWFQRPDVRPEDAVSTLEKAVKMVPGFSKMHCAAAEAQLVWQDRRIQQAARDILATSEEDVPEVLPMDALLPAQEAALRQAGVALRLEEKKMIAVALEEANEAVRLSPWNAMARLLRSNVLFRGMSRKLLDEDAGIRARNDLELVTSLYPLDAGVLADACLALSLGEHTSTNRYELLKWGRRALEIDSSLSLTVLRAWQTAQIPVSLLLEIRPLPISFLWSFYSSLQKQNRDEEAGQCLRVLEKSIETERPPEASILWPPALWKKWNRQQARYRLQIAQERIKRCLRAGEWEKLSTLEETPVELRRNRFRVEWERMDMDETSSPVLRRLRLREWESAHGLLPEWRLEWNLLELEAGMPARWMQDSLVEEILMSGISPENQKRLMACRGTMVDARFLEQVLEAKNSESAGTTAEASARVEALLENELVPPRYFHRIWLWLALLLEKEGQTSGAVEAIQKAALACPSDPDVREAMNRLGCDSRDKLKDLVPKLDFGFRGEKCTLKTAYFTRETEDHDVLHLNLIWRFRGGLPSDLAMEVRIRGQEGRILMRRNTGVDQETSASFNRGNPIPGSLWTWTVPVPPAAEDGRRVEILLSSEGKPMVSDEGLSVLELNMEKLPLIH